MKAPSERMTFKQMTAIVIDKETFDLLSIPHVQTSLVKTVKDSLLMSLDLSDFRENLRKLGQCLRLVYHGVTGSTIKELMVKVQRVGYQIAKVNDKTAVTVEQWKGDAQNVLETVKGAFQYLLDGLEEMALETLSQVSVTMPAEMSRTAGELSYDFEKTTGDVIDILEDTQREKSNLLEENRREKSTAVYNVQNINVTIIIEGLRSSIAALKSLSAIMMEAATFWQQMQSFCESLATGEIQKLVERAMKLPEEKRIKVWTSNAFKGKALRYYSKWVALDDVCGVYMLQIKETRQDLHNFLEENPTIEQARKNVRELAARFENDLKEAQERLEKENMKALEAKKELENSDE